VRLEGIRDLAGPRKAPEIPCPSSEEHGFPYVCHARREQQEPKLLALNVRRDCNSYSIWIGGIYTYEVDEASSEYHRATELRAWTREHL
jgi:hypothetical protein